MHERPAKRSRRLESAAPSPTGCSNETGTTLAVHVSGTSHIVASRNEQQGSFESDTQALTVRYQTQLGAVPSNEPSELVNFAAEYRRKLAYLRNNRGGGLSGHVISFGDNDDGQLGLGHVGQPPGRAVDLPIFVYRPQFVTALKAPELQVATGGLHLAAVTVNRTVYTWGIQDDGALGRGRFAGDDEDKQEFEQATSLVSSLVMSRIKTTPSLKCLLETPIQSFAVFKDKFSWLVGSRMTANPMPPPRVWKGRWLDHVGLRFMLRCRRKPGTCRQKHHQMGR